MRIFIMIFFMLCCISGTATIPPQKRDKEKMNMILKEVYELDQKHRSKIDSLMQAGADNSLLSEAFIPMIVQDEKNKRIVLPLIDSIIHYQINDLDSLAYKTCYLVIQHSDEDVQKKYSGFISSLFQNSYISAVEYMWFIDRLNVGANKSQKYGLQSYLNRTGTLILYPLSDQYKKAWEELGVEFSKEVWEKMNYPPVITSANQFAILGFIIKKQEVDGTIKYKGVEGVKIMINDSDYTVTDGSGYFCFIINKDSIPNSIQIITDTDKLEYKIENVHDADFTIVNYELHLNCEI